VPYDGVQDTLPELQAPQDYQHVQASPAAFGAATAQGLEEAGQAGLKLSDFYEQTAADNAVNNYIQKSTSILRGDPQTGQSGYFQMRGADAMSAYKDTSETLDEALRETRGSLATPLAQKQFDNEARRYRAQYASQMGEHYDQQSKIWATDTNNTSAQLALSTYAQAPDDPFAFHDATEKVRQSYAKNAQLAGENADGAVLKADQAVALTGFKALLGTDPSKASGYLDEHRDVLAGLPNYDQMAREAKTADTQARFVPAVDQFMEETKASAAAAVTSSASIVGSTPVLRDAILSQETGNRDNAPVSANGAVGPGQIKPETFAKYAKPGELITNPKDNRAVSSRIVDDYSQKYNGDEARVAVAYFSGPGNVAPAGSPTPWLRDAKDANGKSVSSYVADVKTRLGTSQSTTQTGGSLYPSQADALNAMRPQLIDKAQAEAERLFPNEPDVQNQFVVTASRRINEQITRQDDMYKVNSHIVQAAMASDHPPTSMSELLAISPQVAGAFHAMQVESPGAAKTIENMFEVNSHGAAATFGIQSPDYLMRVLAPDGDPSQIKDVAALWASASGKGKDAPLTNSGVNALAPLIQLRSTPQGVATLTQFRNFMNFAHGQITATDPRTGAVDKVGDAQYDKFMVDALATFQTELKAGTPSAQMFNPENPHYVGRAMGSYAPGMAETSRRTMEMGNSFGNASPSATQSAVLMQIHDAKQINDDQYARIQGVQRRFANGLITERQARQETLQIAPNLGAHK
jgi:hypothetical protein